MKEITLVLDSGLIAQLGLEANASAADIAAKFKSLSVKAQKVDDLTARVKTLEDELETAKADLETEKTATVTKEITAELDAAVKGGLMSEAERKLAEVHYAGKLPELKAVLKTREPFKSITGQLDAGVKAEAEILASKSWDELHKTNKLVALKAQLPEVYRAKYKEKYGKEPRM